MRAPWRRGQTASPDDLDAAADEAGQPVPTAQGRSDSIHWGWKFLFPWLWFRSIKAGLYVVFGFLGLIGIISWAGWKPLAAAPVAAWFAWMWWKYHYHVEQVLIIEVRAEGQRFRKGHLPFHMKVSDSAFRVFVGPRRLYDEATKYGVYDPIYEVPSHIVICDWFSPEKNVIIFNEDTDWTNAAIVFQLNEALARNMKDRGQKDDALINVKRMAIALHKMGKLTDEEFIALMKDTESKLEIVRESPLVKRSFAHYFQDTIPRLKQQVMVLLKSLDEYALAIGMEMAYNLYNQPMTPEVEQNIRARKDKYGKLKLDLLPGFQWMPELEDFDEEGIIAPGSPQMHDLAQTAQGASGRPTNMPSNHHEPPVLLRR